MTNHAQVSAKAVELRGIRLVLVYINREACLHQIHS